VGTYTRDGMSLAEARQDGWARVLFLFLSAMLAAKEGDLLTAQTATERALALAHQVGSISAQEVALIELGVLAQLRGEVAEAAARYQEALLLPQRAHRPWALRNLGYLALEAGRPEEAKALFREALEEPWSRRQDAGVLEMLNACAVLAREGGRWGRAARLLGATDAGFERLGGVLPEPIGRQARERTLAAAQAGLGEPAFAAAYAAGRALTLAQAVAEALVE
jgi:tetratricopeptide (TPR) repeat protein